MKQLCLAAIVSLAALAHGGAVLAQRAPEDRVWTRVDGLRAAAVEQADAPRQNIARAFARFGADEGLLKALLDAAPEEFAGGDKPAILNIPMPDGSLEPVRVEESPIFSPELQAQYDSVSTYRIEGVDDPTLTGRLDFTVAGFHGMVISSRGTAYVDPDRAAPGEYVSYWKHDAIGESFTCETRDEDMTAIREAIAAEDEGAFGIAAMNPSGPQLRTYRLAISVTGEYTRFFDGNPPAGGTPATIGAITTTVNRVNGIYERELAIRLTLTATRIFTDPATDPFSSGDFRTENQTTLDANPGSANYDIGHIFSQGGSGGVASGGVVCVNGSKARGFTSLANPQGDVFDVDFVAHEIGHQFSARHTWTANTGSCSDAGQFQSTAAYEPGSGSTIMAYAGICGAQNVQANSDAYFHTHNYDEIVAFRTGGNGSTCGVASNTGNSAPTVDAGADCTIPRSTPFRLTASGSDPDGDVLTYLWEQFDLGVHGPAPQATDASGPMFRSRPASSSRTRVFPQMADILSNAATPWEVLPSVDRTLNFRVTARDNRAGGGGVDYDSMRVTVSGGPFGFTAPAAGSSLECGGSSTVSWTIGGGAVAPDVALDFSSNDGASFAPLVSTSNDGSVSIAVPRVLTGTGRLMLVPSTSCFFAVSRPFSIADTLDPSITAPADIAEECESHTGNDVALGSALAADQCDASPFVSNNAPARFPLGTTVVEWTAADDSGHDASDQQSVTVVDTTDPLLTAPADIVRECESPAGTAVDLGSPVVSDVCDPTVAIANNAPALFPLGTTVVNWTATDDSTNASADTQNVTLQDTTPPAIQCNAPATIVPAQAPIAFTSTATDVCDAGPIYRVTGYRCYAVKSNDRVVNKAESCVVAVSGSTIQILDSGGVGTTIEWQVQATDASGNTSNQTCAVNVVRP